MPELQYNLVLTTSIEKFSRSVSMQFTETAKVFQSSSAPELPSKAVAEGPEIVNGLLGTKMTEALISGDPNEPSVARNVDDRFHAAPEWVQMDDTSLPNAGVSGCG
jgi:hypothetical protein